MKALVICPNPPYPLLFGGAIRNYHILKMFAALGEVSLLSYDNFKDSTEAKEHLLTICSRVDFVRGPPIHRLRHSGFAKVLNKRLLQVRATIGRHSFQYQSFYSPHFQKAITSALQRERYDCIVFESSGMAYFDAAQSGAMRILDLHNIEYELLERRVSVQRNPLKRLALKLEAAKFRRDEQRLYRDFDLIFTPSERERDALQEVPGLPTVEVLPNSIDTDFFSFRASPPTGNRIVFVGATHVDANADGLLYFLHHVFPLIERQVPDVQFTIVGGHPPPVLQAEASRPNVTVTGPVPDVREYMREAQVMVVPLRVGGGTRLKILESLSFGLPTVSTSIGAEGLDVEGGSELLIADDPDAFASAVVQLLQNKALGRRIALQGRKLVEQRYSWRVVGRDLGNYLRAAGIGTKSAGRVSRVPDERSGHDANHDRASVPHE